MTRFKDIKTPKDKSMIARMKFVPFYTGLLAALSAVMILSGCGDMPPVVTDRPQEASDALLRLQPGDQIDLIVYGEETLTNVYMLDEDGNINVPLIGKIKAGGQTKGAVQQMIADALAGGGFQTKPYVTVEIEALRPIYINGEVGAPGSFAYQPSLDVFQAVALAGGYTPRASKSKILVTRTKNGSKFRFYADENTPVWPGDSIMVYQRLF